MREIFEAIVKAARPPADFPQHLRIKYSVEDYAIVFSQDTRGAEDYFTRTFKLDEGILKTLKQWSFMDRLTDLTPRATRQKPEPDVTE